MVFKMNSKMSLSSETFYGSEIYTIENFYSNPDDVIDLIEKLPKKLHKIEDEDPNTLNGTYFEDRRQDLAFEELKPIYTFVSALCEQSFQCCNFTTNIARFKKDPFNDYENNYWWPHLDAGYTAIIYLNNNNDVECGTNLYAGISAEKDGIPEHSKPWRSKKEYTLLKTLKPKYNKLVLFDALKFVHGMNISNDTYFGETYRMNQVMFFNPTE